MMRRKQGLRLSKRLLDQLTGGKDTRTQCGR